MTADYNQMISTDESNGICFIFHCVNQCWCILLCNDLSVTVAYCSHVTALFFKLQQLLTLWDSSPDKPLKLYANLWSTKFVFGTSQGLEKWIRQSLFEEPLRIEHTNALYSIW